MLTIRLIDYYGKFPNFNFFQNMSGRVGHQISIFSQIQNSPHYHKWRGGGQENYGLFQQFGTFSFWNAPLIRTLRKRKSPTQSGNCTNPNHNSTWSNLTKGWVLRENDCTPPPEIYLKDAQDMPEIGATYDRNMPEIGLISEICLRLGWDMVKICLTFS